MNRLKSLLVAATAAAAAWLPGQVSAQPLQAEGLYAFSITNEANESGLYSCSPDGLLTHLWSEPLSGYRFFNGWLDNDRICGYALKQESGNLVSHKYQERDIKTGNVLKSVDLSTDRTLDFFTVCTFDPETDKVFGFGNDTRQWTCVKEATPATDPKWVHVIAEELLYDHDCCAICYNPFDQQFYGVRKNNKTLVRINRNTGAYTDLMPLGLNDINTDFNMGLIYLPREDEFLFSAKFKDYSTAFYRIDLKSKTIRKVAQLPLSDLITFFVSTDGGNPGAPMRPQLDALGFSGPSTSGTVEFTMPTINLGGNEISGELGWTIWVDDKELAKGKAKAGEKVKTTQTIEKGDHQIAVTADNASGRGPSFKKSLFVGNDTPLPPTNVTLTEGMVTWNAVTSSVNGGYLNLSDMSYEVYIDNEFIGETKATKLEFKASDASAYARHRAEVIAVCSDIESAPGVSNTAVYGAPLNLDATFWLTEDEAAIFTTINAGDRGVNWAYSPSEHALGTDMAWEDSEAWVVFPPLRFDSATDIYRLSFDSKLENQSNVTLEVYIGTELNPSKATRLIDPFTPNAGEFAPTEKIFTVDKAGVYYLAMRVVAPRFGAGVRVNNIAVRVSEVSNEAPAAVTGLKATAAEGGALTATVEFDLPETDLIGNKLAATAKVTATVTAANSVSIIGAPGSHQKVTVETVQGTNTISVESSMNGNRGGNAEVSVYTGADRPGAPVSFKAVESKDNNSVTFIWEAPDRGAEGRWFDPSQVTYHICYSLDWSIIDVDEYPADARTATFSIPANQMQNSYVFMIYASNAGGDGNTASTTVNLGTPFKLPVKELFPDNKLLYWPVELLYPDERYTNVNLFLQSPYLCNPIFEKDQHMAFDVFSVAEGHQLSRLAFPKVSTAGESQVMLTFDVWTGQYAADKMEVKALMYGAEMPVTIGTIEHGTGWNTVQFMLPEKLLGQDWIRIIIDSEYSKPDYFTIVYDYGFGSPASLADATGADASIVTRGEIVTFRGLEGQAFTVHNLSGQLVRTGTVTAPNQTISLAPGTYVVRCGSETVKAIVI